MRPLLSGQVVTVTGGGGFIGGYVIAALLEHGATVRALMGAPGQKMGAAPSGVRTAVADICETTKITDLLKGAETIVHLAGGASVRESFAETTEYHRVHVRGTENVLHAARASRVKRFVYLSSAEVYGQPVTELVGEDHPLAPRSPYGDAKSKAERLVQTFAACSDTDFVILRAFSVYGPGMSSQSVLGTVLCQARSKDCIWLHDLQPIRDYCYARDLADAVLLSCAADFRLNCILNIGTGIGTSVAELAVLTLEVCGRTIPVQEIKDKERPSGTEVYRLIANNSLVRQTLGWKPRTRLRNGLKATALHVTCP